MEIRFLHERFTENFPQSLTDHIRRMASGEAPFFPATLGLVYDRLVEKAFSKVTPFDSAHGGFTGGQGTISPSLPLQASTSTPSFASSSHSQVPPAPGPVTAPPSTTIKWAGLRCVRCARNASIHNLYDGLHCPRCDEKGRNGKHKKGRPFMICTGCGAMRTTAGSVCSKSKCGGRFR